MSRALLIEYREARYQQFVTETKAAGLSPFHYEGRFFYKGPAVRVDDLQDALRATAVKCQWDNLGLGWVVYPA